MNETYNELVELAVVENVVVDEVEDGHDLNHVESACGVSRVLCVVWCGWTGTTSIMSRAPVVCRVCCVVWCGWMGMTSIMSRAPVVCRVCCVVWYGVAG